MPHPFDKHRVAAADGSIAQGGLSLLLARASVGKKSRFNLLPAGVLEGAHAAHTEPEAPTKTETGTSIKTSGP